MLKVYLEQNQACFCEVPTLEGRGIRSSRIFILAGLEDNDVGEKDVGEPIDRDSLVATTATSTDCWGKRGRELGVVLT